MENLKMSKTIKETLAELMEGHFDSMGVMPLAPVVDSGSDVKSPISDETNLINEEDENIKLSAKSIRTLFVAHIAEQLMSEDVDPDEDLSSFGLMLEGKLTVKGKDWIKKFLPTLYAS